MESVINLGELLFKAMLVNCRHDKAAPQAFQAAAR
jgi:hypothetical protein